MLMRERAAIDAQLDPPFTVLMPHVQRAPIVFCSPHSGRVYPEPFLHASRLDHVALRRSEDYFVDELFAPVAQAGAPLIAARFPRAYVDVNREPYELDPELIADPLPAFANSQTMRVAGGLGTIARIVSDTEEIYAERLPLAVAMERIDRLYKPFHDALGGLLQATMRAYGLALLIDCHSMPSTSVGNGGPGKPDFVIGDRFGASCDARVTRFVRERLAAQGYTVHLNRPYAGGYITEHYGRPVTGFHALQIEINRGLYVDEARIEKRPQFVALQSHLMDVTRALMEAAPLLLGRRQAAAE